MDKDKKRSPILRGLFGVREKRSEEDSSSSSGFYGDGSLLFGALSNAQYGGMNIPALFACTQLISDGVASLPIVIKKKSARGKTSVVKSHPVGDLFDDKNNILTKFDILKLIVQSVILRGNAFVYIERTNEGLPKALRFLESSDVTIVYTKERNELYYQVPMLGKMRVKPSDMLHFKKNTYDGVHGISLLNFAKRTISIASATDNQSESFFKNGGNLSGVIKSQNVMSAKQRHEILSSWASTYSNGSNGVCILPFGMEYQPISISSKDAQQIESRQFNVEDICRFFNVNPVLLGLANHSSYSNLEDVQNDFLVHTLQPWITMIENELDRKLLNNAETNLKIILDTNSVLRANKQAQANYYSTMISSGILSRNEARKDLGMNEVEGGDELVIPYTDIAQNTIGKDENPSE